MHIDPAQISASALYQHLIRIIAPRPIAWVSTVSLSGVTNLAPFSFFTGVGAKPPSVLFCPSNRRDGTPKDSLKNILDTGEFVINVVPFRLAEAMNLSSAELPPDESEFELAGIATAASSFVKPPRVHASPVSLECTLLHHLALAPGPGGANIVVGKIVHLHLDDAVLDGAGWADPGLLDLIGRLGGASYCRTTDRFDLPRPSVP
ncbi:MAG: flavin reductase family protein [Fuerstia sp.]|nr:flavin reductase family protein [Fuerstiella sp.]